jgi:hypothetical protein
MQDSVERDIEELQERVFELCRDRTRRKEILKRFEELALVAGKAMMTLSTLFRILK